MGILNLTKDSFYDGGKYVDEKQIILRCKDMLDEGASIIDVGAQSSRPGATQVSSEEELKKLIPIIKLLKNTFKNITISIDTFWANTAKKCITAGADMINDISGGELDIQMFELVAEAKTPYIIMHMRGTPQNMVTKTDYQDILKEVLDYFQKKV